MFSQLLPRGLAGTLVVVLVEHLAQAHSGQLDAGTEADERLRSRDALLQ